MDLLKTIVLIPSILSGIIFGLLFGSIFIKLVGSKGNPFCLTKIGTKLFGKKTGFKNQFVKGTKGTSLFLLDLIIIAIITSLVENYITKQMLEHPVFYFPFTLLVFTIAYTLIRKKTKMEIGEILVIITLILSSLVSIYALIQFW